MVETGRNLVNTLLSHTAKFADIKYNFQYGGNVDEYSGPYVRKLSARQDIRKHSGLSP